MTTGEENFDEVKAGGMRVRKPKAGKRELRHKRGKGEGGKFNIRSFYSRSKDNRTLRGNTKGACAENTEDALAKQEKSTSFCKSGKKNKDPDLRRAPSSTLWRKKIAEEGNEDGRKGLFDPTERKKNFKMLHDLNRNKSLRREKNRGGWMKEKNTRVEQDLNGKRGTKLARE